MNAPSFSSFRVWPLIPLCLIALANCGQDDLSPAPPSQGVENEELSPRPEEKNPAPKLIILISLDTVRADHLSLYGHSRFTSPVLDVFASEGVIFEDASSTTSWTLPSHASILTGRYPLGHRVRTFASPLPEEVPTLASILKRNGWETAAVVNSEWLTPKPHRLTRDFEHFFFVAPDAKRRAPSNWVTDKAMDWIREREERPLFLFIHYYDAHSNYASEEEFEELFVSPYEGNLTGTWWELTRASLDDTYLEYCQNKPEAALCLFGGAMDRRAVDASTEKLELTTEDLRHLEELYDAGIRQLDTELSRLFSLLDQQGAMDDSLIVITSDHGEEFMEHGRMAHWLTTYQESLHVPLIFRGAGLPAGVRIDVPVSSVDIPPTVLAIAKIQTEEPFDGMNLLPLIEGSAEGRFETRFLYGEASAGETFQPKVENLYPIYSSVRRGDYKMIHNSKENSWALYDLDSDPHEERDISGQETEIAASLKAELKSRQRSKDLLSRTDASVELSPEESEQLRALGYQL